MNESLHGRGEHEFVMIGSADDVLMAVRTSVLSSQV